MNAITLYQPWASLIATGDKRYETRSWRPPPKYYGQPLAIHAAKKKYTDIGPSRLLDAVERNWGKHGLEKLPRGAVVAVVILQEAFQMRSYTDVPANQRPFGDFAYHRYVWKLTDCVPIPPIPARGYQGLWQWNPPQELLKTILSQLPAQSN